MGNFVNKKLEKVRQGRQNTEKRGKLVKIKKHLGKVKKKVGKKSRWKLQDLKKKQNWPIENKLDEVEEKSCRENCTKVVKKREKSGQIWGKGKKSWEGNWRTKIKK